MPEKKKIPLAYFITFTTYGTWLHGTAKGSFMKGKGGESAEFIGHEPLLHHIRKQGLKFAAFTLSADMIRPVDEAIRIVCDVRNWQLHALNVRTNHIHMVVSGQAQPGKILGDVKRYATRRLRNDELVSPNRRLWTEGGSKRYLWDSASLNRASQYVTRGQGLDLKRPLLG